MDTVAKKINDIVDRFSRLNTWEDRYREMIHMGKALPSLDNQYKVDKFRIKGCQSQVWLVPEFDGQQIEFRADSDSLLVKGIISILVYVYSGASPQDILDHRPDFLSKIGISDHLSMNRTNGLASMIKQLQMYAYAYSTLKRI